MKKTLFEFLQWANPKNETTTHEYIYFQNHLSLFSPETRMFRNNTDFFSLIKSDIILSGLDNRVKTNNYLKTHQENFNLDEYHRFLFSLPQNRDKHFPILIPTYSPSINKRYLENPQSLYTFPYEVLFQENSMILNNPFEVYGTKLFSSFSELIPLSIHDRDSRAYYHENLETIFIINNLGGLETYLPLFDEKMKSKDKANLKERLSLLLKNYYENDKQAFLEHLASLNLLSPSLYQRLLDYEQRRQLRKERIRYR